MVQPSVAMVSDAMLNSKNVMFSFSGGKLSERVPLQAASLEVASPQHHKSNGSRDSWCGTIWAVNSLGAEIMVALFLFVTAPYRVPGPRMELSKYLWLNFGILEGESHVHCQSLYF